MSAGTGGGMLKRVRAKCGGPELLLTDEPTPTTPLSVDVKKGFGGEVAMTNGRTRQSVVQKLEWGKIWQ